MNCNKFQLLEGCSKCSSLLNNNQCISKLSIYSIVDIFDILAKESNIDSNSIIILNRSTIDCIGNINLVYSRSKYSTVQRCNKYVCYEFINIWLKENIAEVHAAINVIYIILCASILCCNEREQRALELLNILDMLIRYIQQYMAITNKL